MPEPRVLLFDLENTPITGYAWGVGKYDRVIRVQDPWYILCVGYRWLGEDTTHCFGIDDTDVKEWNDDRGVVAKIHELFTEADVLVAHNGDRFDIPKARARMIIHGMKPPKPCLSVDTLKMARKEFEFTSNSLDAVCQVLGLGRKSPTGGFDLWLRCMAGDEEAWRTMKAYCQSDVELLEKLYLRLRPWAARHPNLALIGDKPTVCPKCSEDKGFQSRGWRHNAVSKRAQWQCKACGGWSYGREVLKSDVERVI